LDLSIWLAGIFDEIGSGLNALSAILEIRPGHLQKSITTNLKIPVDGHPPAFSSTPSSFGKIAQLVEQRTENFKTGIFPLPPTQSHLVKSLL